MTADAIILAYKRLNDVEAFFGVGKVLDVAYNRDYIQKDGAYATWKGQDSVGTLGEIDSELPVLVFKRGGKPLGALISFACHQDTAKQGGYSGDFSSILAKELKKQYGQDFVRDGFGTG